MIETQASVTIDRPVQEVFDYVTEPANEPRWQFDVIEVSWANGGPLRVGSRLRRVVKFMGRRNLDIEVTALVPPRRVDLQTRSGAPFGLRPLITYQLEDQGSQTRFTRRVLMSPSGAGKLMEPMMRAMVPRYNRRFLAALKERLEGAG
jgi:uncharacterized protein YndB with AHSA1/START domain